VHNRTNKNQGDYQRDLNENNNMNEREKQTKKKHNIYKETDTIFIYSRAKNIDEK